MDIQQRRNELNAGGSTVTTVSDSIGITHILHAGLEKPIEGFWIFDRLVPRAGLVWTAYDAIYRVETETTGGPTQRVSGSTPATYGPARATAGIGIDKGIFSLDVVANFGSYSGIVSGPAVVLGTLTLDFGRTGGASSAPAREQSAPAVPSTPSYESSPTYDSGSFGQ